MSGGEYKSRSAREAQATNYGDRKYWDYLEQSAHEHRDYFLRHPELGVDPQTMLTESLAEALAGNEGQ